MLWMNWVRATNEWCANPPALSNLPAPKVITGNAGALNVRALVFLRYLARVLTSGLPTLCAVECTFV